MPENWRGAFEHFLHASAGLAGFVPTALMARLLWHRRMVDLGRRRLWSCHLVWELPAAIFGAVVGGGAAEWLGLSGMAAQACVGVVAWLGPRGLEEFFLRPLSSRFVNQQDE